MKKHNTILRYKPIIITIFGCLILNALIVLVDYFDLLSRIGFHINHINLELIGIVVGNSIVICLYLITFYLFDKRRIDENDRAEYAGYLLLMDVYQRCDSCLYIMQEVLNFIDETGIPPKAKDFLIEDPFENNEKLLDLLISGKITVKHYDEYCAIKEQYHSLAITIDSFTNKKQFKRKIQV